MGDISKNFNRKEFACKCGCGFDRIDPRIVDMAQKIREAMGEPIRINSGCRCPKRNAEAGGVGDSYHMHGTAADLSCDAGSAKLFRVIKDLFTAGKLKNLSYCRRYIGLNFVHIDCGKTRVNRFHES